jgi:hypothetical protein
VEIARAGVTRTRLAVLSVLMGLLGCGSRALEAGDVGGRDGSVRDVGACSAGTPRLPLQHRAAGAACPGQRGAGGAGLNGCTLDAGSTTQCVLDSECTAGVNGRCLGTAGPVVAPCQSYCSYDVCSGDSDCPAREPCECRASASDLTANVCVTGSNCQVDSDCGPGGYCSPSQVGVLCFCPSPALCGDAGGCSEFVDGGWVQVPCSCGDACGHGYFCHTCNDTCVDDSDCGGHGTCNYDTPNQRWSCSTCFFVP